MATGVFPRLSRCFGARVVLVVVSASGLVGAGVTPAMAAPLNAIIVDANGSAIHRSVRLDAGPLEFWLDVRAGDLASSFWSVTDS